MSSAFDHLSREVMAAARGLSLVTDDEFVVLDEERQAITRVVALVQEWSLSDRRPR